MEYEKTNYPEEKAVEKPSRVREEMMRLAEVLSETDRLVDRLDGRLAPIINSVPSVGGAEKEGTEIIAPHVQEIKDRRLLVENINRRLNYLLKNLEI